MRKPIRRPSLAHGPRPLRLKPRRLRVRLATVVLALGGVAILGLTLMWPLLDGSYASRPASDSQTLAVGVREFGFDRQNRPYSIRARTATKREGAPDQIFLTDPEGEITNEDGAWLTVTARSGRWDETRELLFLSGDVRFHHGSGLEFATEAATVDPGESAAWGDRFVTGQGPSGELRAPAFRVLPGGRTVVFPGPSRLLLPPSATPADHGGNTVSVAEPPET